LSEQGELSLVGERRAEHPQDPAQLLVVSVFGNDRMP
jgi:hypothetical protein